ncbi:hypothetical protein BC830DRAFT_666265 [Chytriomyces sp. MP71]|nr:hypothetical protein BC830DRAFT_666265 [Chytriomyces sp. MP71]
MRAVGSWEELVRGQVREFFVERVTACGGCRRAGDGGDGEAGGAAGEALICTPGENPVATNELTCCVGLFVVSYSAHGPASTRGAATLTHDRAATSNKGASYFLQSQHMTSYRTIYICMHLPGKDFVSPVRFTGNNEPSFEKGERVCSREPKQGGGESQSTESDSCRVQVI